VDMKTRGRAKSLIVTNRLTTFSGRAYPRPDYVEFMMLNVAIRARSSVVVKALYYKTEVTGFDSR
jgi:hypothetical protein